ncbi:MAG: hypothetical protein J0L96_06890 [Anaerolineae bacterium]|nr:hypothetical protein [Anaerolineae bacterium]
MEFKNNTPFIVKGLVQVFVVGVFILSLFVTSPVGAVGGADLVVTNVVITPANPAPGEAISVSVTILNQGDETSESIVYRHVFVNTGNPNNLPPDPGTGCPSTDDPYENYFRQDLNDGLPPGISDTKPVSIPDGLPAGNYEFWVYVDATCINEETDETNNAYGPLTLDIGAEIEVSIGGINKGTYYLGPGESTRQNYVGVDSGPAIVEAQGSTDIIAALRDAYFVGGQLESFVQLMGLPKESLSTTYYFPAYNNVTLDGQLRFSNVGNSATTVTVTIAGVVRGTYPLNPGEAKRVNYIGLDSGPVVVSSSGGIPIIAALRDAYFVDGRLESFAQLMGLPQEKLSTSYYFPAYNNVTLDGQLRIGNVGNSDTTVTVTIAGVVRGTYPLSPSQAVRINYAGLDAGPVVVESSDGVPIIAALRDAYFVDGKLVSFVQLMGLPQEQLSTNYNFPAYNNVTLDGQLRFGNVGISATTVTVTIAGLCVGPIHSIRVKRSGSIMLGWMLDPW